MLSVMEPSQKHARDAADALMCARGRGFRLDPIATFQEHAAMAAEYAKLTNDSRSVGSSSACD